MSSKPLTDRSLIDRIPKNDFVTGDDGYVMYWPIRSNGGPSAHSLRVIAEYLDQRNAEWEDQLKAYMESEK